MTHQLLSASTCFAAGQVNGLDYGFIVLAVPPESPTTTHTFIRRSSYVLFRFSFSFGILKALTY